MEKWREIPDFPNYEASNLGRVRRSKPGRGVTSAGRVLKPRPDKDGYLTVGLFDSSGKKFRRRVHRLVLGAFVGPCPDGLEGCHGGGVVTDNRLENLRWDTHANNQADRFVHGTVPAGETSPLHKLTDGQVIAIRNAYSSGGITQKQLAEMYGVTRPNIGYIVNRKTWKYLGGQ